MAADLIGRIVLWRTAVMGLASELPAAHLELAALAGDMLGVLNAVHEARCQASALSPESSNGNAGLLACEAEPEETIH